MHSARERIYMFTDMLTNVQKNAPLIHNITNYVTANDCANALLACGASPVMADSIDDAAEITSSCDGLCINLGTLHRERIPVMLAAGTLSNKFKHPVLLDPVGVGASTFRMEAAKTLIDQIHFTAIRGNLSEIKALAYGTESANGVDAGQADQITEENLPALISFAKDFAGAFHCVVIITGIMDIVADTDTAYLIRNGHDMMRHLTGTGCQLSALTTAFLAANPEHAAEAAAAAVSMFGCCGEIAAARLSRSDGTYTFRNYLMDAVFRMTPEHLERSASYEIY